MYKRSLLISILFFSFLLPAQVSNFLKTFTPTAAYSSTTSYVLGGMGPQGIATLSSSSFILGGFYSRYSTLVGDTLTEDSYLIKNRTDGLTMWFRKYHLAKKRLIFYDVGIKDDKCILAVGTSNDINNQLNPDGVIFKTDSNGYLQSVRVFPSQSISKITVLKDKKIAILATDSNKFAKLILLDQNCNLIWSKKIIPASTAYNFSAYELIEGKNKSLLMVGQKSFGPPNYTWYPFALLCDSTGNKINDFAMPTGSSYFLAAGNNFDTGFYIIGAGVNSINMNALNGYVVKVNNQLQMEWFKTYECNITHVEYTDIILYGRNNISILTEPEPPSSWSRRAGFTFIDSLGSVRKSYLFNPINTDQYPDKMIQIQGDRVLFTLHSNAGRLFGVTDTVQSSFCNSDTLVWVIRTSTLTPQYNSANLIASQFNFVIDTATVHTPKDAELLYVCSVGPTAPLDTINYPPPPPPPPSTLTSIKSGDTADDNLGRFSIQPNPVSDCLTITTNRPLKSPVEITIINSVGKTLVSKGFFHYIFPLKIDVVDFPAGLYILSIKSVNAAVYKTKFLIVRE
jgi:hypothetical protein